MAGRPRARLTRSDRIRLQVVLPPGHGHRPWERGHRRALSSPRPWPVRSHGCRGPSEHRVPWARGRVRDLSLGIPPAVPGPEAAHPRVYLDGRSVHPTPVMLEWYPGLCRWPDRRDRPGGRRSRLYVHRGRPGTPAWVRDPDGAVQGPAVRAPRAAECRTVYCPDARDLKVGHRPTRQPCPVWSGGPVARQACRWASASQRALAGGFSRHARTVWPRAGRRPRRQSWHRCPSRPARKPFLGCRWLPRRWSGRFLSATHGRPPECRLRRVEHHRHRPARRPCPGWRYRVVASAECQSSSEYRWP